MVSDAVTEAEMEALPRMLTRLKLTAIRDRLDELRISAHRRRPIQRIVDGVSG